MKDKSELVIMLEWHAPQKKLMTLFYRKQIPDSESTDMSCTCGHVFKEIKLIGGKRFSGKTEIVYDESRNYFKCRCNIAILCQLGYGQQIATCQPWSWMLQRLKALLSILFIIPYATNVVNLLNKHQLLFSQRSFPLFSWPWCLIQKVKLWGETRC